MKRLIFFGIGLVTGAGIGCGLTYIFTKNNCEKRTQEAIDDMKHFYEDEHKTIKGFEVKEQTNEKEEKDEDDVIRKDKPPISEMSSLVSGNSNNSSIYTNYHIQNTNEEKEKEIDKHVEDLKKRIKDITESNIPKQNDIAVIDRQEYVKRQNLNYKDRDYSYDAEKEQWVDEMSGSDIDIQDLPFNPEIIQWDDLDQCYILDETNKSIYMLEKLES